MGKWLGSNGNTVTILPFTDKGFKFTSLDCTESIGGKFANGRIKMVHDGNPEALKLITNQETVEIELGTNELGVILTIHGVIINKKYFKNFYDIEFICVPDKNFLVNRGQLIFDDIDLAIKSLWKGKIENRTKTDLPGNIKYNQGGEYDRSFLGTLCKSYKKDTIYAFGLDNLLIKDLIGIDSTGHKEPYWTFLGGGANGVQDVSEPYEFNYDHELYKKPEDSWEEAISDPSLNLVGLIFDKRYRIIHKDYNILRENMYNNQKLYNSKMYNHFDVTNTLTFQSYRLGDVVKYKRPGEKDNIPFSTYIISSISYHYQTEPDSEGDNQFPFKQEYTLHCLEEKGRQLNDIDPKDEQQ